MVASRGTLPCDWNSVTVMLASVNQVKIKLLRGNISLLTSRDVAALAMSHSAAHQPLLIGNLNLHGVFLRESNEKFARFCAQVDIMLADGMPLVWLSGAPASARISSTDWITELGVLAHGLKVLIVSGTPSDAAVTQQVLTARFPRIHWDCVDGYAGAVMSSELRSKIDTANVILVGMGMPLQEEWILENFSLLAPKVVANVGGCFDYFNGRQKVPPRLLSSVGLEWLFRLLHSPRRLGRRYLVEPLHLILIITRRSLFGYGKGATSSAPEGHRRS
ncbi:N-acetylglucosaminyldiphosphoundecaprenol N-acetyl-beta-D-mannosaminyltransferase [Klenkia brasiliensis]|uniref:N-acetylglucosaminyldiphosphoundecaprenol N-acetyl-beta-D-mannosaminyltransferase n=2 Tax=Klenkia brasiliensis TaxID=333142 RepID=A0A1G7MUF9_9ACTN|nr:N-acetylglucosaminyldiphosphoundecaprenol N-acetyl-beta-D-mannosaminyltransferase [Klenkia brasiliensis]